MTRRATAVLVLGLVLGTGCRDGVGPYELPEGSLTGDVRQLTFNDHPDYAPSWSRGSDTVYYSTGDFLSYRGYVRSLLGLSVDGGTARNLVPGAQTIGFGGAPVPALAAPVFSPDGDRLAYAELTCYDEERELDDSPYSCVNRYAKLSAVKIRVRDSRSRRPVDFDRSYPAAGGFDLQFRPSWSPDGERLAFTDRDLRIWDLAADEVIVVPGTTNAMNAAWHPARNEVAFSRGGAIFVVDLETGSVREVTAGDQPAWSPDGSALYVAGATSILRVPAAGGAPAVVPGTIGGRWPAVSPDGRWLAFMRTKNEFGSTDWDIWLVRLD